LTLSIIDRRRCHLTMPVDQPDSLSCNHTAFGLSNKSLQEELFIKHNPVKNLQAFPALHFYIHFADSS
jgi:hypothetical protein